MSEIIQKACSYKSMSLVGEDPSKMQDDNPLRILMKDPNDTFKVNYLKIRDCGLPLRVSKGKVEIGTLDCSGFTADLFNSGSDLHIKKLVVQYDNPNFVYGSNYHVDALGQLYCKSGIVKNVTIDSIVARIKGPMVQGMMLSEPECRYSDFYIGVDNSDIQMEYKYAFVAGTLENSIINVGPKNGVKIKNVKHSKHPTSGVYVVASESLSYFDEGLVDTGMVGISENI